MALANHFYGHSAKLHVLFLSHNTNLGFSQNFFEKRVTKWGSEALYIIEGFLCPARDTPIPPRKKKGAHP